MEHPGISLDGVFTSFSLCRYVSRRVTFSPAFLLQRYSLVSIIEHVALVTQGKLVLLFGIPQPSCGANG